MLPFLLKLRIPSIIQIKAKTQKAPRKGGNPVICLNVGIAHNPESPTINKKIFSHLLRTESLPLYMFNTEETSTLPTRRVDIKRFRTHNVVNAGKNYPAENADAVTLPLIHNIREVISPITVKEPPMLAAINIAHAYIVR